MSEAVIQDGLFGAEVIATLPSKLTRAERQREKAKKAYKATSAAWKRTIYSFAVNEFLPKHASFIFEELSIAYDEAAKLKRWPVTVDGRAFAGLQATLVKERKISAIEGVTQNRTNGSPSQVYRSNLYQGS